ncbi:unnamed protein product [Strongylus vulgaris]|uniref:Uncharacterized protein n=1 Tax=Strongylus vulgaris TaxID=40348 RepID=A0A3P7LM15_STRVU|nr:unnamed protein product [Strongylus vulgaris]
MVFYERNGEKRHEMVLQGAASERRVIDMQWDVESSCLFLHFRGEDFDEVEIWTVSNYDWKRQWSTRFEQKVTRVHWDIEKARLLCILFEDGTYCRLTFDLSPIVVNSTALVIATEELRLTEFDQCPVPPPMCGISSPVNRAIHAVAFDGKRMAVLSSDFILQNCEFSLTQTYFELAWGLHLLIRLVETEKYNDWSQQNILVVYGE